MADLEGESLPKGNVSIIEDLSDFPGDSIEEKVDALVQQLPVVILSKTYCPFCRDVKDLLGSVLGVHVHSIEWDKHPDGAKIFKHLSTKYSHYTSPIVFIRGNYIGGCDDTKALYHSGELEQKHLVGLMQKKRTVGTERLETARLVPKERSQAMNAPMWFPATVNNNVVRATGVQVCLMAALSAAFHWKIWARYLAVGLLVDFTLRMVAGSGVSPLGMIANFVTSPMTPDFRPGPPKQFAAFCGLFFSTMGTIFYFVDFEYHDVVGAVFMGGLAGAAGMEGFLDFCLGCVFYSLGIQFGLLPDTTYRIHTATRQETIESWNYKNLDSGAPAPEKVDTDPASPISLKYKKKTDEWTKDDFDLIRNMQVVYFGMPLAIGGLAMAFKIAGEWSDNIGSGTRVIVAQDTWYHVIAVAAAAVFAVFCVLYMARAALYPRKIAKEWDCPLRSNGFGLITISLMLFAFLIYDEIEVSEDEEATQLIGRYVWWVGAGGHALLTIAKFGEWMGRRLELEHVHPHWMILPVGLAVAALVAPLVKPFPEDNENSVGNQMIARFFYSFAWLMWITLFVITFFKVVTTHNSDNRLRHGVFIWLAAPCILGLAEYSICVGDFSTERCEAEYAEKYFIGIFIFCGLFFANLPHIGFFGQDPFNMGYWNECFALDTLAACAALFYAMNGYQISRVLMLISLTMASVANATAFLHTATALVRRRDVFTPEVKWGPLSFMKLTHEAFRGNLATLQHYIDAVDVSDTSPKAQENIDLFAAHFNRFCMLHEEHSKHEDEVIFKTFNDFFPEHARTWNDDHAEDHKKLDEWRELANKLLDTRLSTEDRKAAFEELRKDLPSFFVHFEEHLRGEEDNLQPIGRKYLPLAIMKDISRKVWDLTPASKWEVIIPFIVTNLPRHMQRVRYVKVLCWSMPERAQQIGAIIYRNVDAVMWERLRTDVPEIIPRGAPGWKRYY